MSSDSIYCFLDANVLIHFRAFQEVDWPQKLQARHVYLVLVPTVLRELNKYKDDNKNEARRRRVRSILPRLEGNLGCPARVPRVGAPVKGPDGTSARGGTGTRSAFPAARGERTGPPGAFGARG